MIHNLCVQALKINVNISMNSPDSSIKNCLEDICRIVEGLENEQKPEKPLLRLINLAQHSQLLDKSDPDYRSTIGKGLIIWILKKYGCRYEEWAFEMATKTQEDYLPIFRAFLVLCGVYFPGAVEHACTFGHTKLLDDIVLLAPSRLEQYKYNPFLHMLAMRKGALNCFKTLCANVPLSDDQYLNVMQIMHNRPTCDPPLVSEIRNDFLSIMLHRQSFTLHDQTGHFRRLTQLLNLKDACRLVMTNGFPNCRQLIEDWTLRTGSTHDRLDSEDVQALVLHHHPEIGDWIIHFQDI
jgi:hypothetical protein